MAADSHSQAAHKGEQEEAAEEPECEEADFIAMTNPVQAAEFESMTLAGRIHNVFDLASGLLVAGRLPTPR